MSLAAPSPLVCTTITTSSGMRGLEPEPDLSFHSTFEDSIWPITETTTDATLN